MAGKLTNYSQKIQDFIQNNLKCVNEIWHEIGFDDDVIEKRNSDLVNVLCDVLDDVKYGEIELKENIIENCEKYKQKISDLAERLRLDDQKYKINMDDESDQDDNNKQKKTLLEEEKYYKSLFEEIEKIKHERQQKFAEFKVVEHELCDLLDETSYLIEDTSAIPEFELENLENHIVKLAREKQKRISLIKQYREDIMSLGHDYEIDVNQDESVIDDLLNASSRDDYLLIDNEFIENIKESYQKLIVKRDALIKQIDDLRVKIANIWQRLNISNESMTELIQSCQKYNKTVHQMLIDEYERCLIIKQENMVNYIKEKRNEIESLWEKCYYTKEDRQTFTAYTSVDFTDEILEIHEIYSTQLNDFYESNKEIFELFKNWQELWSNYVSFEQQYSDPTRFKARNYSALFEERERRRFQNELPKIEQQIDSQNKDVKVFGVNVMDYIKETRNSYIQQKEEMRKERQNKKEHETRQEAHFGTMLRPHPLTPQNRKHKLMTSSASASSTSNLVRSNATSSTTTASNFTSFSSNKFPFASKNTTTITVNSSGKRHHMAKTTSINKENIVKRSLYFNNQHQNSPNSPATPKNKQMRLEQIKQISTKTVTISPSRATIHQQNKQTTTRTAAASTSTTNNPSKRPSIKTLNEKFKRRSKRPSISVTKKAKTNNSIQTDSNDSGNGGSAGTSTDHHALNIPKILIQDFELMNNHVLSDLEYDDIDDDDEQIDFHNDVISSTLLEN